MNGYTVYRQIIGLIVITAVAACCLFAIVYWNDVRDRKYHARSLGYHVASLKHIAVLKEQVRLLVHYHLPESGSAGSPVPHGWRLQRSINTENELLLIRQAADALRQLHERYGGTEFNSLSARVQQSLQLFRNAPLQLMLQELESPEVYENLMTQLQQLERLHLIVYEEREAAQAVHEARGKLVTFLVAGVILLMTLVVIGLLLKSVRLALVRQRQADAALKSINEGLDRSVQERTRELQLARDEAERANRAKSEFLSRMSHELRTPMNAVLGAAELLQYSSSTLQPKQQKYIGLIKSGGNQMLDLINEILDLARVEAGRIELKMETLPVSPLVRECVDLLAQAAAGRQLQVENQVVDEAGCIARADYGRLRQVLLNLISNAIKYNRQGGRVTLHCECLVPGRVRLGVSDTGAGIALEDQSRIFQPFNRLPDNDATEGAGIGLAVSRQLVELMGGRLTVDSRPGEGSTFWIELEHGGSEAAEDNVHSLHPAGEPELNTGRVVQFHR